jgi:hypothetical protein
MHACQNFISQLMDPDTKPPPQPKDTAAHALAEPPQYSASWPSSNRPIPPDGLGQQPPPPTATPPPAPPSEFAADSSTMTGTSDQDLPPPPLSSYSQSPASSIPASAFLPLFNQTANQRRAVVDYPAVFSGPAHAGQWHVKCTGTYACTSSRLYFSRMLQLTAWKRARARRLRSNLRRKTLLGRPTLLWDGTHDLAPSIILDPRVRHRNSNHLLPLLPAPRRTLTWAVHPRTWGHRPKHHPRYLTIVLLVRSRIQATIQRLPLRLLRTSHSSTKRPLSGDSLSTTLPSSVDLLMRDDGP